MTETNWGFYNYFLKDDRKTVVLFTGEHRAYALYTINFLPNEEATYEADRSMLELDISSYIPKKKIYLTSDQLEGS